MTRTAPWIALLLMLTLPGCPEPMDDDDGDDDTTDVADDDVADDDGADDDAGDDDTGDDDTGPPDADGDGYDETEDCDDSDPDVNPGADEECGNGIDDNCDGETDPCGLTGIYDPGFADAALLLPDPTEPVTALDWAGDGDGDGQLDVVIGLAEHVVDEVVQGAAMVVRGPFPPGDTLLTNPDALLTGVWADSRTGAAVAGGGDVDGDGFPDVAVGAPDIWPVGFGSTEGAVYLALGPVTGEVAIDTVHARFGGSGWDECGGALALDGDLNADGYADLLIGDPGDEHTCSSMTCPGTVFVVYGPVASGGHHLDDADVTLSGAGGDERAGTSLAHAGDVDGDGYGDLLIGAPRGTAGAGTVYLVRGPTPASGDLSSADAILTGMEFDDGVGVALAGDHDLTGDATPDLLLGAPGFDKTWGAAFLFPGPPPASAEVDAASAHLAGGAAGDALGAAVAFAGDTDGNGLQEVMVRSAASDNVVLFRVPISGDIPLADAAATFQDLGSGGIAPPTDLHGDGYDDLAFGAVGGVYLFFGTGW